MNERGVLAESSNGILERASGRLHSFFCGLHGHDMVLNIQPGRLSLQCMSCPYETPGWTIKEPEEFPGADRPERGTPALVEQNAQ